MKPLIVLLLVFFQPCIQTDYSDIFVINRIVEDQMERNFGELEEIGVMFKSDSMARKFFNHPDKIGKHYLYDELSFIGVGFGLDNFAGILVSSFEKNDSIAKVGIEVWTLNPKGIKKYDVIMNGVNSNSKINEYVFQGSKPRK